MHHPFCCGSALRNQISFPTVTTVMPASSNSGRSDPIRNSSSQVHNHINQNSDSNHLDVKINDILVGNGICGILQKWVNYGKGWRPRWFVLEDGVVSYYKIHGPDKVFINQESVKGFKVIGDDSQRRISRHKSHSIGVTSSSPLRHAPVGEVHLKVSSIQESRSDDKKFSIFTGTKRLHMRAETQEDRQQWLEALHAVKGMFPRMSNSELMAPLENVTVSTEKLRQRLLEEGVSEAAIQDSEQIMRNEFASLQNQLILVRQKHWLLIDTLRHLEVHKMTNRKNHASRFRNSSSVSSAQNA